MATDVKKSLKILAVCGMGLGSGLVLRMSVDKVLKELNIKATTAVSDVASAKGERADIIVTSSEFEKSLVGTGAKVITIKNYVDLGEIRTKLSEALGEVS